MMRIRSLGAALIGAVLPSGLLAQDYSSATGTVYATVRDWVVVQSDMLGCSAYVEGSPMIFNTPPAGGWQLVLSNDAGAAPGEYPATIDIDRYSFADTFFVDSQWAYASFPLGLRQAMAAGSVMRAEAGPMTWELTLGGTTAALLKLEECWADLTGWSAATSSRAGTFAFSGD